MNIHEISPAKIAQKLSIQRAQTYLDTGEYPFGQFNLTWDLLEWIRSIKS